MLQLFVDMINTEKDWHHADDTEESTLWEDEYFNDGVI
jgi:hypothetical protein